MLVIRYIYFLGKKNPRTGAYHAGDIINNLNFNKKAWYKDSKKK